MQEKRERVFLLVLNAERSHVLCGCTQRGHERRGHANGVDVYTAWASTRLDRRLKH
jgi:hypothetical protein